jgi:hypothetical protein
MSLRLLVNSLESLENSEVDIPMPVKPVPSPVVTPRTTRRGTSCTALFCPYLSIKLDGDSEWSVQRCELKCGDI